MCTYHLLFAETRSKESRASKHDLVSMVMYFSDKNTETPLIIDRLEVVEVDFAHEYLFPMHVYYIKSMFIVLKYLVFGIAT